jgi:hypothetical protein
MIKLIEAYDKPLLEQYNHAKKRDIKDVAWLILGYGFVGISVAVFLMELFN